AEFTFGKTAVESGRKLIAKAMKEFGHKAQVSVSDSDESTISYVVATDSGPGIKVPVKFSKGLPVQPTVALANGTIEDFTNEGINKLLSIGDFGLAAQASKFSGMKSSEILDALQSAIKENNTSKAEDAL